MGERVRQKYMSVPQPKFLLTDAVFKLRSSCKAWIVVYIGSPLIGGMVGFFEALDKLIDRGDCHGGRGGGPINNLQS